MDAHTTERAVFRMGGSDMCLDERDDGEQDSVVVEERGKGFKVFGNDRGIN
jgi:hypothetical protein